MQQIVNSSSTPTNIGASNTGNDTIVYNFVGNFVPPEWFDLRTSCGKILSKTARQLLSLIVIQNKLDRLMDFLADGTLTREEFFRKKAQLKERQYELTELIKSYDKVDDKLSKKLVDFISISINAYETFKGSTIDEKRELLNFIFSNLTLEGCKLHYVLAFPFTEMQKVASCAEWRGVVNNFRTQSDTKLLVIQTLTLYY